MATIPTPVGVTDGVVAHGATLDVGLVDCPTFLLSRPYCNVQIASAVLVSTGTQTLVSWNSEVEDNDGMHDSGINPSRITCKTPGVYLFNVGASWSGSAASPTDREIMLRLNSGGSPTSGTLLQIVDQTSSSSVPTNDNLTPNLSWMFRFANVGDYIETFVLQEAGVARNLQSGSSTYFQALWQLQ